MNNISNKTSALIALLLLAPSVAVHAQSAAASTAESTTQASFDIWEYRVLGNTVLANETVEGAVYPFLGPGKTLVDVEQARTKLEQAYRDAGFGTVFVDVPEQDVDENVVRLRVTEGRIDRVRITGARYFSNGRIRAAVPALAKGTTPHLPELQAQLSALNQAASDRSIVPVLKAGRTPGTVDVELKVDDSLPVHASLEVNDRYSADTSRLRTTASVGYSNLFQQNHNLLLQYQTAPEDPEDVESIVASYVFGAAGIPDLRFAVYAADSNTDVATVGTLSVIGQGQIYGARAILSLPATDTLSHAVTFGLDYKDFLENIRLTEVDGLTTPIQYLNWSAAYDGTLRSASTITSLNVAANLGVRSAVNDVEQFEAKRFKGSANYLYLRAGGEHVHSLPLDLQLAFRAAGQFTQNPLVSSEQFSIGGVDTVRGFLESSYLGDYGATGSFELRHGWPARLLKSPPGSAYVLAFYDAGIVQVFEPLPGQQRTFDLESAGVGFRIEGWRGLQLGLDWAYALSDSADVARGDDRTHFNFRYGF